MSRNYLHLSAAIGTTLLSALAIAQGTLTVDDLRVRLETHYSSGNIVYECRPFRPLYSKPQIVKRVVAANRRGDLEFECRPFIERGKESVVKLGVKDVGFVAFIGRLGEIRETRVAL